jgi:hypothetical protein
MSWETKRETVPVLTKARAKNYRAEVPTPREGARVTPTAAVRKT